MWENTRNGIWIGILLIASLIIIGAAGIYGYKATVEVQANNFRQTAQVVNNIGQVVNNIGGRVEALEAVAKKKRR